MKKWAFIFLNKGTPNITFLKLFFDHSFGILKYIFFKSIKIYMTSGKYFNIKIEINNFS
jgi:hypothetical protein